MSSNDGPLSNILLIVPSHYALCLVGAEEDMAHSSIRFGIGRFTTEDEIDFVTGKIVAIVERECKETSYSIRSSILIIDAIETCRCRLARFVTLVGNGPRGYRHQDHRLVSHPL